MIHVLSVEVFICMFRFTISLNSLLLYFFSFLFFFFFFKQKTAYEIKECDWSSDVCSSDLSYSSRPWRSKRGSLGARQAGPELSAMIERQSQSSGAGKSPIVSSWIRTSSFAGLDGSSWKRRSEERRVGKECRSRWSPYH